MPLHRIDHDRDGDQHEYAFDNGRTGIAERYRSHHNQFKYRICFDKAGRKQKDINGCAQPYGQGQQGR